MKSEQVNDLLDRHYPVTQSRAKIIFGRLLLWLIFILSLFMLGSVGLDIARDEATVWHTKFILGLMFLAMSMVGLILEHRGILDRTEKPHKQHWLILADPVLNAIDPPPRTSWEQAILRFVTFVLTLAVVWLEDEGAWLSRDWPRLAKWIMFVFAIFLIFAMFVQDSERIRERRERIQRRISFLVGQGANDVADIVRRQGGRPQSVSFEQIILFMDQYAVDNGDPPLLKQIARHFKVDDGRIMARFRENDTTYSEYKKRYD